jgi:hypothetical protein
MGLRQDAQMIANRYKEIQELLTLNCELLDIQEGNLLKYVNRELELQLSKTAFDVCKMRIPPINVQKRVIDKLSQIYAKAPKRDMGAKATDADRSTWQQIRDFFNLDVSGQTMNEYFNLHKSCAWEPYLDDKFAPRLRELPKDRFFVIGADAVNKMRVTHFVKVMGTRMRDVKDPKGAIVGKKEVTILFAYTDLEFLAVDDTGDVADDVMAELSQYGISNVNPFRRIPFVYVNRSKIHINAPQDSDMYRMVTLIPILFGDLNYALMFQAFSIWYGVNVDVDKIPINPNSFVGLRSDPNNPGAEPKIGCIKPEVDSDKVISSITEQLSLWLQSRNIRPGTVGRPSDNHVAALSKMVDEMDTSGDRQKQIPFFKAAEEELYDLVANVMHPVWQRNPSYQVKVSISPGLPYSVTFPLQVNMQTRLDIVEECQAEKNLGVLSSETALRRVNPDWDDVQVAEEMARIKAEAPAPAKVPGDIINPPGLGGLGGK